MFLNRVARYVRREILHREFYCKIFSTISKNGQSYISKKSLYDFFKKIDEISPDIKEYHENTVRSFIVEECIPIKVRMAEMHVVCSSIYNMKGAHSETIEHLANVREYTNRICHYLKKSERYKDFLDDQTVELISMAAFMHDISKIIMDNDFLYDGRRFNSEERLFMNTHPLLSFIMIEYIKKQNPFLKEYLDNINIIISEHHESLDGSGYPAGKKSNEIGLGGRILKVADVFEAMMAKKRKYKQPINKQEAIAEMLSKPHIYEEFIVMAMNFYVETSSEIDKILEKYFTAENISVD